MSNYLFECIDCRRHYAPDEVEYLCPACAAKQEDMKPLFGLLRCIFDYEKLNKQLSVQTFEERRVMDPSRYAELLPLFSMDSIPPLITDITPLRRSPKLEDELKLSELFIKDDTCLPTASFKDRASSLVVACARERERDTVATASTGNAAVALAAMAASMEMRSVIFVPETAPRAKLTQIAVYGGELVLIKGNYDQAFELSIKACDEFGWYNRNTGYNPFTVEGKKTAALEIWEQLEYSVPDWVVVPTGDGVILAGIEKGFSDLKAIGLIERVPRLAVVQAAGCQPIVQAFASGRKEVFSELNPKTIADSISVGVPRAGRWVMQALESCGGAAVAVTDEEILESISLLGRSMGLFAEPAAAASIAGLKKLAADGTIGVDERVVALITGNGLKDIPAASRAVTFPESIEPTPDVVRKIFS